MKKINKLTKILVSTLALTTLLGSISCFATEGLVIENKKVTIGDKYIESYLERLESAKRAEDRIVIEEVVEETQPSDTKKEETPKKETSEKKENTKVETPKKEETKKEEVVTYKEVNETVYVTKDVNVRKGPGTSFNKVGSLNKGDNVTRTGIGSNGWSKIIYNGKEAYVSSNYLTTEKVAKEEPKKEETKKEETKTETPKQEEKKEEKKSSNVLNSKETYSIKKSFGGSEVERKYAKGAEKTSIPSEYKDRVVELYNLIMNSSEAEVKYEIETSDNRYWSMLEHYTRIYAGSGYRTLNDQLSKRASSKEVEGVKVYTLTIDIASARAILNDCKAEAQKTIDKVEAEQAELDKEYEAELAKEEKMRSYIKNAVSQMNLNGNKVHDLKQVHDWICKNAKYDDSGKNYNVYHLVNTGKTQCSGYARMFQKICNYIGINVKYVSGYGKTSAHAWNSVKIDGQTWYIDVTWDDTLGNTQYFLKDKATFSKDHSW